jgi:hypothetical protein
MNSLSKQLIKKTSLISHIVGGDGGGVEAAARVAGGERTGLSSLWRR